MKFAGLAAIALTTGLTIGTSTIAQAQTDTYYAGVASNGLAVQVETDSIHRMSDRNVNFVYYLGGEQIFAQADCVARNWTSMPDQDQHFPRSLATERMLNFVCSQDQIYPVSSEAQTVRVVDPPSNVRATPNGRIICTLPTRMNIQVFGAVGSWYRTDACGRSGYIHSSQIRF